jgi:hypothetical protein
LYRQIYFTVSFNLDINDDQWFQSSLPIGLCGLGIRRAFDLAPSAFLASAASSTVLVNQILPASFSLVDDIFIDSSIKLWTENFNIDIPVGDHQKSQKVWDGIKCSKSVETLMSKGTDECYRARLLAAQSKGSGDWLKVLPISFLGLRMNNDVIRIAAGLRLGSRLCLDHTCVCGMAADSKGYHGLSCNRSKGRIPRHCAINDITHKALNKCNLAAIREPNNLSRTDGKKPDGVTLIPWSKGKSLMWDATIPNTMASSYLKTSSSKACKVTNLAEKKKSPNMTTFPKVSVLFQWQSKLWVLGATKVINYSQTLGGNFPSFRVIIKRLPI